MRRGEDVLLTAPFYSNPGFLKTLFRRPIYSDTNLVDRLLPDVSDAKTLLVGHAHYDHLLDVPYVANYRATNAVVYGNNTMSNILCAAVNSNRLYGLDKLAGEFTVNGPAGRWVTNQNIRFMPLKSKHSPHIGRHAFFAGEVPEPLTSLPKTSWDWLEGQTLAYLIDFLGPKGEVNYRISYHDTAVNYPPLGGIPPLPDNDRRLPDVTILCLGSSGNVDNYPDFMLSNAPPSHVIIGHWENFFKPLTKQKEVEIVPFTNGKKFVSRVNKAFAPRKAIVPLPGAWMIFPPAQASSGILSTAKTISTKSR